MKKLVFLLTLVMSCITARSQNDQLRIDNEVIANTIQDLPLGVLNTCSDSFFLSAGGNVAEYRFNSGLSISIFSPQARLLSSVHEDWIWQCGPGGSEWSYLWGGDTIINSELQYKLDQLVQTQLIGLQKKIAGPLMMRILERLKWLADRTELPYKWTAFEYRETTCPHWWGYIHDTTFSFELMRMCPSNSQLAKSGQQYPAAAFQFQDLGEISPRITLQLYPHSSTAELSLAYVGPYSGERWPKYSYSAESDWSQDLPPEVVQYLQTLWRMITPALSGN
jgi:hypothetical protein